MSENMYSFRLAKGAIVPNKAQCVVGRCDCKSSGLRMALSTTSLSSTLQGWLIPRKEHPRRTLVEANKKRPENPKTSSSALHLFEKME
jgi:hypothetical protein